MYVTSSSNFSQGLPARSTTFAASSGTYKSTPFFFESIHEGDEFDSSGNLVATPSETPDTNPLNKALKLAAWPVRAVLNWINKDVENIDLR
jgi:hypothetical protein